jgi:YgiT-type zinc finger domain-containing protein
MTSEADDVFDQVQRELASWRSTHPRATFAEIEVAVEQQIQRLRTQLLSEHAEAGFLEERPLCPQCGAIMTPRARSTRTVLLQGDRELEVDRDYLVCRSCGEGLFPPG